MTISKLYHPVSVLQERDLGAIKAITSNVNICRADHKVSMHEALVRATRHEVFHTGFGATLHGVSVALAN